MSDKPEDYTLEDFILDNEITLDKLEDIYTRLTQLNIWYGRYKNTLPYLCVKQLQSIILVKEED